MVKFQTKVNQDAVNALLKIQTKRLTWTFVLFSILFTLIGVLFIVDAVLAEEGVKIGGIVLGALFIIIFGVGFYPLCKVLIKSMQKKLDQSNSAVGEDVNAYFEFTEKGFLLDIKREGVFFEHTEAVYSYLYRVTESDEHYFLYLNRTNCHVIPKSTLIEGELEDLNSYLRAGFKNVKGKKDLTYFN